jgi:hypothetical protein
VTFRHILIHGWEFRIADIATLPGEHPIKGRRREVGVMGVKIVQKEKERRVRVFLLFE